MSWPINRDAPVQAEPTQDLNHERSVQAFASRHYPFVWRVLRGLGLSRADAEDAAQQVLMIATRKLDTIEPDRERSFVYGVAVRVAKNVRRGLFRRREVLEAPADEADPEAEGAEETVALVQARALLHDLLAKLPQDQRRVLILAEIEGLELRAIAEYESIPQGTAASRLRLARARFRTLLGTERHRNPFA
ncbi:MAG: sigma-70 family RNA polymerase sigma factor [Polyangiaceae bacterium]|nr:sigma-70 family RNA polymerase sigma factor [Polyangiaceae bacterium]